MGEDLLTLRLAVLDVCINTATYRSGVEYVAPASLFLPDGEAAVHGEAGSDAPTEEAVHLIAGTRNDVVQQGALAISGATRGRHGAEVDAFALVIVPPRLGTL